MYRILERGSSEVLPIPDPRFKVERIMDRSAVCTTMARHMRGAEVFSALDGKNYGFWVGDPDHLEWIFLTSDQVFVVEAGTWHFGPIPLESKYGLYLMVAWSGTEERDSEHRNLPGPHYPPFLR